MAHSGDKHHRDVTFHTGDLVYVNIAHFSLDTRLSRKLAPRWVGPFPIEQVISSVAYCISLPAEYGYIHPVYFMFPPYIDTIGPLPSCTPPIFPVADCSSPEYEVEDILAYLVYYRKL